MPIEADSASCVVNHGPSNFSVRRGQPIFRNQMSNIRIGGVPGGSPGSSSKCSNMVVVGHAMIGVCTTKAPPVNAPAVRCLAPPWDPNTD